MTGAMRTGIGGRVDRTRVIHFSFDGKRYQGLAGDTLASALIANGVHLMGRSFKYHRPRGPLSMGSEEPNALVTVNAGKGRLTPNLRATQVEIYEGLRAKSQNAWPSLERDALAINGAFSAMLPAGFYYKTFIGPKGAWEHLYEPAIRRAAGLGVAPTDPDPDHFAYEHRHCEVAVVGAGPAGLAAALRRRPRGRPGDPVRRTGGVRRLGARGRACEDRRQAGGGMGRRGGRRACRPIQRDAAAAHPGLWLLRAELPRRRAARHRPHRLSRPKTAARAFLAGAGGAGDRRHRRTRAAAGVPRQ